MSIEELKVIYGRFDKKDFDLFGFGEKARHILCPHCAEGYMVKRDDKIQHTEGYDCPECERTIELVPPGYLEEGHEYAG